MNSENNDMQQNVSSQEELTKNLQNNLKKIRAILDIDQAQLGDMIGVSRQTINNIENGRVKLNKIHYVAIMAILDQLISKNPHLKDTVSSLLSAGISRLSVAPPIIGVGAPVIGSILGASIGYLSIEAILNADKKNKE